MFGQIVSGIGAAVGLYQGAQAKKDAKDAGKKAAKVERRVTEEQIRQLERQYLSNKGANIAQAAYGGAGLDSGSLRAVQQDLQSEYYTERDFTREVGISKAKVVEREAKNYGDAVFMNSLSQALQFTGSLFR